MPQPYSTGTVTVTMKAAASATLAAGLGLTGAQNAAGQVLALPYRDALALVQAKVARFGSAAQDTALAKVAQSQQVTVGTNPVQLAAAGDSVAIQAPAGATLYIGGADVTAANGWPIAAGQSISLDRAPGEGIYGVLASGTGTAPILRTGV